LFSAAAGLRAAEPTPAKPAPAWLTQPLSLAECLNLALDHNSEVLKSKSDLEAAHGIVVQTRAIVIPKVRVSGDFSVLEHDATERLKFDFELPPGFPKVNLPSISPGDQRWNAGIRLVQSIYEGGRMSSALRAARLTREQALLQHQTVIADTLLQVRVAYYDILLAAQQIVVQEASVKLLERELQDQTHRYEAGTVPRFNVLRAEVEVANAKPRLIRARNSHRIAKNNLVMLLGHNLPKDVWEDLPLTLTGALEAEPYDIQLPTAIGQALEHRTELAALRKAADLRREGIVNAKAGALPSAQVFAGYTGRNSSFTDDLGEAAHGWIVGTQLTWDPFDGFLTRGKVAEAKARHERALEEVADTARRIELEVRTAYSNFIEAREVLESQKKVKEQAEEALRLATARSEAGTGTQLDVLSAQTALTEARTTEIQALHAYVIARARLERAMGLDLAAPGK
jgi:outer membrane protein TolC